MKSLTVLILLAFLLLPQGHAAISEILGPVGSVDFGGTVTVLPNGNLVVIDTDYIIPGGPPGVGAVYLVDRASHLIISKITGSTGGDAVGLGGITILTNGNFVIKSPLWSNGAASSAGAVTWGSATLGVSGVVSAANSLVGGSSGDSKAYLDNNPALALNVTALTNGNYVVSAPAWDNPNGPVNDAGAVTWCNGETGRAGVISADNSLVGGSVNDRVGSGFSGDNDNGSFLGVIPLSNGNYVVKSSSWDDPAGPTVDVGAVTWCDGSTGTVGLVSTFNSLTGIRDGDSVGDGGVKPLPNGNYVVGSTRWQDPSEAVLNYGAATWCSGTTGRVGVVSTTNSLYGILNASGSISLPLNGGVVSTTFLIVPLPNGNYLVISPFWDNVNGQERVGAVTWCDGTLGKVGQVSSGISLVGNNTGDLGGDASYDWSTNLVPFIMRPTVLTNGNYVVISPKWSGQVGPAHVGAATWCDGSTGRTGYIGESTALIGTSADDGVDMHAVALSNGNYVVSRPHWDNSNGPVADVGAVTWCDGKTGRVGTVSTVNSLVGGTSGDQISIDQVGSGLIALSNGNYAVLSPFWHDSVTGANVGAVTWCDGSTGQVGAVTAANSLIGGTPGDQVGYHGVALNNGNFVVGSPRWNNPGQALNAGAVTWCSGTGVTTGVIGSGNSLIGSTAGDQVGDIRHIYPLPNGNYLVSSTEWSNPVGSLANAGAVTWCNGNTGRTGLISADNSLVGGTAGAYAGQQLFVMGDSNYVFLSGDGPSRSATFGYGGEGTSGVIDASNSILNDINPSRNFEQAHGYSPAGQHHYVGIPGANKVLVTSPAAIGPKIAVAQPADVALVNGGSSIDFGIQNINTSTTPKTVTITNIGSANVTLGAITKDGSHSADFTVTAVGTTSLTLGASTTFTITFKPSGLGVRNAAIHISSNDVDKDSFDIVLTGTGVPSAGVPSTTTTAATGILSTGATLQSVIDPRYGFTTVTFEYGLSTAYGATMTLPATLTGTGARPVSAAVSGLLPHTLYHFRVKASNKVGTAYGSDKAFTTANTLPTALTDEVMALPGALLTISPLSNDSDADNDTLKLDAITAPPASAGLAKIVGNSITFTPAATFAGTTFTYTVSDGFGGKAVGSIAVSKASCALSPQSTRRPSAAGSYAIAVATSAPWTATENLAWASVSPVSSNGLGTVTVTLQANTSKGSRSGQITIGGQLHTVTQAGSLGFTIDQPSSVPTGKVSVAYSLAIPGLLPPVRYTSVGLPAGLKIDATSGVISGVPDEAGVFNATITGTTSAGASTTVAIPLTIDPLPAGLAGAYAGIVDRNATLNTSLGGTVSMNIATSGALTGTLRLGTVTHALVGRAVVPASGNPSASIPIVRLGKPTLTVSFDFTPMGVANGTITDGTATASLVAGVNPWTATHQPLGFDGAYNALLDLPAELASDASVPQGFGFFQLSVTGKTGATSLVGRTSDGVVISGSGSIWADGSVPLFALLYSNKGSVRGLPQIALEGVAPSYADNRIGGAIDWQKTGPSTASDTTYKNGFGPIALTVEGSKWLTQTSGEMPLGLPNQPNNLRVEFADGGIENVAQAAQVSQTFQLLATGVAKFNGATAGNPTGVAMTLSTRTGLFSGSFKLTDPKPAGSGNVLRTVSYSGLLVAHLQRGYGWFLLPGLAPTSDVLSGQVLVKAP